MSSVGRAVKGIVRGVTDTFGLTGGDSAPPPAAAAAQPDTSGRAAELATRQAALKSQARAAGATRNENQADLLGDTKYTGPKKKAASSALLG